MERQRQNTTSHNINSKTGKRTKVESSHNLCTPIKQKQVQNYY